MESTEKSTRRSINSTRNNGNGNLKSSGITQTCWGSSEKRTENRTITAINQNRISSRTLSRALITSDRRCIQQSKRTGTWNNIRVKNMNRIVERPSVLHDDFNDAIYIVLNYWRESKNIKDVRFDVRERIWRRGAVCCDYSTACSLWTFTIF